MPYYNRNPFGKSFASSENKSYKKKVLHQRFHSEKGSCFSASHGTRVDALNPPDAWGALEEMLYEQDCRFSSGQ